MAEADDVGPRRESVISVSGGRLWSTLLARRQCSPKWSHEWQSPPPLDAAGRRNRRRRWKCRPRRKSPPSLLRAGEKGRDRLIVAVFAMQGFGFLAGGMVAIIVPAEIFPARLRSTCHGISAAAGKAGAMIGAFGFLYAAQNKDKTKTDPGYPAGIGVRNSLFVLVVCNALGFLFTFLVPESKGKSLEEMSGENEEEEQQTGVTNGAYAPQSRTVPV